jgi:hypothetical protein
MSIHSRRFMKQAPEEFAVIGDFALATVKSIPLNEVADVRAVETPHLARNPAVAPRGDRNGEKTH